jgi:hypothetical protein
MRKLIGCMSAGALAVLLTGCVGPMGVAGGAYGYVYTDVSGPVLATSNAGCSKVGTATSKGIVCVATGDSSIKAACANGGITKISHVDYHVTSVLGLYVETTVTVYGE